MIPERSILAVPGLEKQSGDFLRGLWKLSERHGWNADAIATVISLESAFDAGAQNPYSTSVGLLQWIQSSAVAMGTTRAALLKMTAVEQLKYVEVYFANAWGSRVPLRPVDYYLAGWGARAGLPSAFVLARKGDNKYEVNAILDVDDNGVITVSDLERRMVAQMSRAGGRRIPVPFPRLDLLSRLGLALEPSRLPIGW